MTRTTDLVRRIRHVVGGARRTLTGGHAATEPGSDPTSTTGGPADPPIETEPAPTAEPAQDIPTAVFDEPRQTLADPHHQAHLERFGFAIIPAIPPEVLGEARQLHTELGPAPDDPQMALNWTFHSQSSEHKRAVKDRMLSLFRPYLEEMFVDHEVYLTTFITKWPGPNSGFAPHQDPTLVDERRYRGVTVWIPLHDTGIVDGLDNCMLHFVPGSHRFATTLRVSDVDQTPLGDHEQEIVGRHGVGAPTTTGDVLVFDNRVIHYSMPNETDEPRVVMSFGMRPSEGACVLLRQDGEGGIDIYEIDDDFYIDVLPAQQHLWEPDSAPIDKVRLEMVGWSPEEFAALCAEVPQPSGTIRAGERTWKDPGVFCALCGSTDGLGDADRESRNNAQLVCADCTSKLQSSSA